MADLDQEVLDAAEHRGQYLLVRELVALVERDDQAVERGVPVDRLEAYADALAERGVQSIDGEVVDEVLEGDLTAQDSWDGEKAIYDVGDGVSAFPSDWHDELAGEDDIVRFVQVMSGDLASGHKHTDAGAAGEGVPEPLLLDAASALGPFSRDGATSELERLYQDGAVEERADQHPKARVWPSHE